MKFYINEIQIAIRNFFKSIANLFLWAPVIWRDRNYDFTYIYVILRRKLELHASSMINNSNHISADNEVKWIHTCIRLIDKINNDEYLDELQNYFKVEYSDTSIITKHVLYDYLDEYFVKYSRVYTSIVNNKMYKLNINDTSDRQFIAMLISVRNHDRAKRLLYKILEEHIETWWY